MTDRIEYAGQARLRKANTPFPMLGQRCFNNFQIINQNTPFAINILKLSVSKPSINLSVTRLKHEKMDNNIVSNE